MLLMGSIILHHIANVVLMSRDGKGLLAGGSALGWVQALVGVPMYITPLFTTVKAAWSILHSFGACARARACTCVRACECVCVFVACVSAAHAHIFG